MPLYITKNYCLLGYDAVWLGRNLQTFRGTYYFRVNCSVIAKINAVRSSKTSISFYQIRSLHTTEHGEAQSHGREKLTSFIREETFPNLRD
jgi:hypothetical protein